MPELTVTHIVLLALTTIVGAAAGWMVRGSRSEQEKAAVSAGWQEQIDAQRREHERLVDQNKALMEQVSQFQAQHTDAKNRAKELSLAVQEAYERRDALQREIKDIRGSLETVLSERDQLASNMQAQDDTAALLQQKDERIAKLAKELENWQKRLPPLIERYRARNEDAERLEAELADAQQRILELESSPGDCAANETRIEPVNTPEELTDGLDASNDPADDFADVFADDDADEALVAAPADADDSPAVDEDLDDEPLDNDDEEAGFPRDSRDDLKMIKGVGPAIEKTLNEMGIFRFRQIADMSEYDIDRVARRLKGFHSRIYREDWIGQARALLDEAAHA
jgi:predicted flap endonuclease-1-like 5' DNA nuclease/predicted  nucleic acid-binding Zn-ribbon protein